MADKRDIVVTNGKAVHRDKPEITAPREEDNNFFKAYAIIEAQSMEWVQAQLWKLGWPYERVAIRVLDWEEAVTRLKRDELSMLAMTRMIVCVEDQDKRLWVVRTPDLVLGRKDAHVTVNEASISKAVDAAYKIVR